VPDEPNQPDEDEREGEGEDEDEDEEEVGPYPLEELELRLPPERLGIGGYAYPPPKPVELPHQGGTIPAIVALVVAGTVFSVRTLGHSFEERVGMAHQWPRRRPDRPRSVSTGDAERRSYV